MVSHHHKCIFIHIPKNAGQSIENVFLDLIGLSWEMRDPLLLRHNTNPMLGPKRLAHLKSHEYVEYKYVSPQQYKEYITFAVIRNPWERAVSFYKYLGYYKICNFEDFIVKHLSKDLWHREYWFLCPQSEFIYYNGRLNVDYVLRFENLEEDFKMICKKLNLQNIPLPRVNVSKEQKNRRNMCSFLKEAALKDFLMKLRKIIRFKKYSFYKDFKDYYTNEARDIIKELYKEDIKRFGYKFDDTSSCNDGK